MNLSSNIKKTFSNTRGWFVLCLCSIAIGLSLSKPLMALGLFGLLIVWLIDGNILEKIKRYWHNKAAVIISSIYLITVFGLVHTSNYEFAIDDLRRKLPLFFIPFFISGFNFLTKKELFIILKIYVLGVLIATFWSFFVYLGGLNITVVEVRDYARFNSHIRFGLEISIAAILSLYFFNQTNNFKLKLIWLSIFSWLFYSLFLFGLITGIIVFLITTVILFFIYGMRSQNKVKKIVTLTLFSLFTLGGYFYIYNAINGYYSEKNVTPLEEFSHTKKGEKYGITFSTNNNSFKENGYFISKNIAINEFAKAWDDQSDLSFYGKDLKGQLLSQTLIRFVTSKGERKDAEAIERLSNREIKAIESGIPNYNYIEMSSVNIRLHKIIWEYDSYKNGKDINGHSMLMRWTYWKTALKIIKNNIFIGVGTGDVQDAFNQNYKENKSTLTIKNRLRTHNQYLTYFVSFGILGFCWFIFCLLFPLFKAKIHKNYLYIAFLSILLLSMLTEDTLETQVGINLFVFFNTLFLLNSKPK